MASDVDSEIACILMLIGALTRLCLEMVASSCETIALRQ